MDNYFTCASTIWNSKSRAAPATSRQRNLELMSSCATSAAPPPGWTCTRPSSSSTLATAQIAAAERDIAQTENALSLLLGQPARRHAARQAAANNHACRRELPAGLPSALLERRPDIRQAEAALDRRQRADRRGAGALLPANFAHRLPGRSEPRRLANCSPVPARLWTRRPSAPAADLQCRPDPRRSPSDGSAAARNAAELPAVRSTPRSAKSPMR